MKRASGSRLLTESGDGQCVEDGVDPIARKRRAAVIGGQERALHACGPTNDMCALKCGQRQSCVVWVVMNNWQVDQLVAKVLGGLVGFGRRGPKARALVVEQHVNRRELGDVRVARQCRQPGTR